MKRNRAPRDGPTSRPSVEDFNRGAVIRAVLKEVNLHPLTFPPVVLGFLTLFAAAILPWKIPLILGGLLSVAGGLLNWGYQWFLKGEDIGNEYVNKLRQRRTEYDLDKVEKIETELLSTGFDAGAKEAGELRKAYHDLVQHLEERLIEGKANLPAEQFRALADDIYAEGMGYLEQALAIYNALESIDLNGLKQELRNFKGRLERLKDKGTSTDRRDLESQISSHEERIELYQKKSEQLAELLVKSDELEKVLETTLLKVASLSTEKINALIKRGDAAKDLRLRVEAAHMAEERAASGFTGRSREQQKRDEDVQRLLDQ